MSLRLTDQQPFWEGTVSKALLTLVWGYQIPLGTGGVPDGSFYSAVLPLELPQPQSEPPTQSSLVPPHFVWC